MVQVVLQIVDGHMQEDALLRQSANVAAVYPSMSIEREYDGVGGVGYCIA